MKIGIAGKMSEKKATLAKKLSNRLGYRPAKVLTLKEVGQEWGAETLDLLEPDSERLIQCAMDAISRHQLVNMQKSDCVIPYVYTDILSDFDAHYKGGDLDLKRIEGLRIMCITGLSYYDTVLVMPNCEIAIPEVVPEHMVRIVRLAGKTVEELFVEASKAVGSGI